MTFTSVERRWITATMEAFAHEGAPGLSPRPGEVDWLGTVEAMYLASNPRGRLGVRLGVLFAGLAPLWTLTALCTLPGLPLGRRTELLSKLLYHRWFAVRGLVLLLKLAASFALLGVRAVRDRSGYDRAAPQVRKRHLPVLTRAVA
ncbi:MAG: hypothetical protein HY909_16260 [Deltaproteobacteria bacterium]|nr:hypothetical protein [Deltaproteobacteria bacterium]